MQNLHKLLLIAALPLAAGCLSASAETAATDAPLPLDLLSDAERSRAIGLALADAEVQRLLEGQSHEVIGASLKVDKERSFRGDRLVDVHVYRYGANDVVWPVVELREGVVDEVRVERFQPSLTRAEIARAEAALLSDPSVLAFVGPPAGVGVRMLVVGGEAPCDVDRCVEAQFLRGDQPLPAMALFDLSAMRTVRAWDGSARTAGEAIP